MYAQRSRDAIKVTWKTRDFRHVTSEHYKVSKSEVFEKVIPAVDFWISADDIMPKIVKISGCFLKI